jgi:hypothetical protein
MIAMVKISIVAVIGVMVLGCSSTKTMLPIREIDRPQTLPKKVWKTKGSFGGSYANSKNSFSYQGLINGVIPSYGITDNFEAVAVPTLFRWRFYHPLSIESNAVTYPWSLCAQLGANSFGLSGFSTTTTLQGKKKLAGNRWFDGYVGCDQQYQEYFDDNKNKYKTYLFPMFLGGSLGFQFTENFYLKSGISLQYKNYRGMLIQSKTYGRSYSIGFPFTMGFNVCDYFTFVMSTGIAFNENQINKLIKQSFGVPTSMSLIFQW